MQRNVLLQNITCQILIIEVLRITKLLTFTKCQKWYAKSFQEITENYQYNAKFTDNILIVGHTGCGKATFVQNLAKNKMSGKLKSVNWI